MANVGPTRGTLLHYIVDDRNSSNNATIVIMAPIALQIAHQIGLSASDARAFILTTCIAASASFITPIGYQTNTFVYSVGGYKFGDFMKIGIFLNIIYCLGTIALVSTYWIFGQNPLTKVIVNAFHAVRKKQVLLTRT